MQPLRCMCPVLQNGYPETGRQGMYSVRRMCSALQQAGYLPAGGPDMRRKMHCGENAQEREEI